MVALGSLSAQAEMQLTQVMSLEHAPALGPFICLDNLDMQEKVHMVSVGQQNTMFHGTWGYVQLPAKSLLDTLDMSQINLAS